MTESDLRALVENGVREGRSLEYKLALPGGSDAEKREFLADVASLANSGGGDLLFGFEEARDENGRNTGVPERIAGLAAFNEDHEALRLTQLVRSGIEPLLNVELRSMGRFDLGPALVLRVPKSWRTPHMVTIAGGQRFYGRSASGKHLLAVDEIRSLFRATDALPDQLERLRQERVARILSNNGPVSMPEGSKVILHLVPAVSLGRELSFDVRQLQNEAKSDLRPIWVSSWNNRFNFDGFLSYAASREEMPCGSYVQVFRSGVVEAVAHGLTSTYESRQVLASEAYEKDLINAVFGFLAFATRLGIAPPFFVGITLAGVEGAEMGVNRFFYRHDGHSIDRPLLFLPDVHLETGALSLRDLSKELRPAFDTVWQAAGWEASLNYDSDGFWVGQRH